MVEIKIEDKQTDKDGKDEQQNVNDADKIEKTTPDKIVIDKKD